MIASFSGLFLCFKVYFFCLMAACGDVELHASSFLIGQQDVESTLDMEHMSEM